MPDLVTYSVLGQLPINILKDRDEVQASGLIVYGTDSDPRYFITLAVMGMNLLRKTFAAGGKYSLLECLDFCERFQCSDHRDKIYSVLAVASDKEKLGISPKYRASFSEVFVDTAVRIVHQTSNLDLLNRLRRAKSVELPSWVPDWSPVADLKCPSLLSGLAHTEP